MILAAYLPVVIKYAIESSLVTANDCLVSLATLNNACIVTGFQIFIQNIFKMISPEEEILLEAAKVSAELLPRKSCERYENEYRLFCKWRQKKKLTQ